MTPPTGKRVKAKLVVEGLSKTFQGQRALEDVTIDLREGEIHCLLGQNGSGKSTLIKVLAGYHVPDAGAAWVDGEPLELGSAVSAHQRGLRFIHQDLALIDSLSVVDNLALGEGYHGRFWLSDRRERQLAQEAFAEYGVDVDAGKSLGELGAASRTMTAIVRALHHGDGAKGVLVLDEPTASLSEAAKDHLFALLRDVKARGGTLLYVTHRLQEVFELADRVSVLRDGRKVATREVAELDHNGLVELILGRSLESLYPEPPAPGEHEVLGVSGLQGGALKEFGTSVRAGEIVGVVGLSGSGIEEVPHLIFGAQRKTAGEIRLMGERIDPSSPWEAIRDGLAFVPGDRKRLGGAFQWTLRENVTLPKIHGWGPLGWLSGRREAREVMPFLTEFDVKPSDPEATLSSLSGGNQQKVMIARWMRCGAKAYLFEEPTAGVDIGSRSVIYQGLNRVAADGAGVLITTSDFEEACAVCDRIHVIRHGRVGITLNSSQASVERLLAEALQPASVSTAHA